MFQFLPLYGVIKVKKKKQTNLYDLKSLEEFLKLL